MKKTFLFFSLMLTFQALAQKTWKLDPAHAKMTFTVTHLGLSEIDGVFQEFGATITHTEEDFSDAKFEATANLKSVSTNNERRDAHLQRDDMFDTENHPNLVFKSTAIEKIDEKKYKLRGDLSIKGVTKSVDLDLTLMGTAEHPRSKKQMAGFKVTGTVNRSDFGVGNMPAMMVSHKVELRASGEFIME